MANRIFCYLQQEFLSQFHLENRFDIMITENGGKWRYFHSIYHLCNRNAKMEWKKMDELIKVKFHVMHRHRQNEPLQSILQRNLWIKMGEYYASISYPGQWFYALRHCYRYSKPMQSQRIFTFKLTAKIYENRKPCVSAKMTWCVSAPITADWEI